MAQTFRELKRNSKTGEALEQMNSMLRFNVGTHKRSRLIKAGAANSGSLLHRDIARDHAKKLAAELGLCAQVLGKEAEERLRFMTILEELTDPTVEAVKGAVDNLECGIFEIVGGMKLRSRGAIELEMVNLDILERIKEGSDDEARKLTVLKALRSKKTRSESLILVHCHLVVDLGKDSTDNEKALRARSKKHKNWNKSPYQVEIKSLFKDRAASKNLSAIASYVTKGGNENLRYNAGFGRDLAEDLDMKMWRAGGSGRAARGGETVEDDRGLTLAEVKQLDELYVWLMKRRRDRRGYIIATGKQ